MIASEFPRRVRLDEIGSSPRVHDIAAEEAERAALTERLGLASLERLKASIVLSLEAAGVRAKGRVNAVVEQVCVVSGRPIAVTIDEPVNVIFVRHVDPATQPEEGVELSEADCDVLPLEGDAVDIGELAAETLSLALDPYPRLSDEELGEELRLLTSEEEAEAEAKKKSAANNPFAALKDKKP